MVAAMLAEIPPAVVAWADVTSKPAFGTASLEAVGFFATAAQGTLATNAQPLSAKGQANGYASLDGAGLVPTAQIPSLPAIAVWGTVIGTLSNQTDLQTALDAKVPTSRTVNGQALSSNVTVTTITGNAGTATALATPRTINGVSFDGTANITVTAAGSTLSDNVPTSKLNSGSGADATTFWRGDGSWQTPAGGSGLSQPQVMARAQFAGAF